MKKAKMIIKRGEFGRLYGLSEPAKALRVTRGHLSHVLRGDRESKALKRRMRELGIKVVNTQTKPNTNKEN